MLSKIATAYMNSLDYFIPPQRKEETEFYNQARMFLVSHTIGPFFGNTIPLALFLFNPTPHMDIFWLAVSITGFWIFPFLLKCGINYEKLVIASVINLNFCIFWGSYFNGSVSSPTLGWILIVPILSFFYIGGEVRLQSTLLLIFASSFAIFLGAYVYFAPPPSNVPPDRMIGIGVVSTLATLAYVATMAIYYSRIFDAGTELEKEVARRRQASDELRLAMAAADREGRTKAEFLARMSHELRTPLNAIIGYSQILMEDADEIGDDTMARYVAKINDAGQYLVRLINMILDLSKIEAGRMQFRPEKAPLAEIITHAVEAAKPAILENGNRIELEIENGLGDVETDTARLQQILNTILSNAGQNTKDGLITIACSVAMSENKFHIFIKDTGKGIAPDRLAILFDNLADIREAAESKYGGTGLSLTVAHRLAQAMGCSLAAESQLGRGSCFKVTVPLTWQAPRDPARVEAADRAEARDQTIDA